MLVPLPEFVAPYVMSPASENGDHFYQVMYKNSDFY